MESHQEAGVEQFPDLETSATWPLVDVETSNGTWGVTDQFIWAPLKHIRVLQEMIKLIELPQRSSGNGRT